MTACLIEPTEQDHQNANASGGNRIGEVSEEKPAAKRRQGRRKKWRMARDDRSVRTGSGHFGCPLHLRTVDAGWLTQTVTRMAQVIYNDRLFDHLPILADALEEAEVLFEGRIHLSTFCV